MARTKSAEVWKSWPDRFLRYQDTDLTVAAFCDREGVSQAAFYVWRKKLQPVPDELTGKLAGKVELSSAPAFVQILSGVIHTQDATAKVVLTLIDGTRVELPASDRELIAHVVLCVATSHSAALLQAGDR